ncbi:cysteine-rich secretory protein 3-like isoform X2 [Heterocephalus glaber]|nr:cysteine-rich secretory protein 3-like isoform X2 [Heterocephalus glaber]
MTPPNSREQGRIVCFGLAARGAMALFSVILFPVAMLLSSFPVKGDENEAFAALSTSLPEVQEEIVNKHNELRRAVSPTASDMLKM